MARTFVDVVRRGRLVVVSGMTAMNRAGVVEARGDMVGQAAVVYSKIELALGSVGASFSDVVFTRDFVVATDNYAETAKIRYAAFDGRFPAATGVIVSRLLHEDALIEVDVLAVLPPFPVRATRVLRRLLRQSLIPLRSAAP